MRESSGNDSIFGAGSCRKLVLRTCANVCLKRSKRVRRGAERFEVSPSSAVKWIQRWQETGSIAAKPIGGSISPLEKHADWLLMLISEHPDLTLDEVIGAMRKRRI